MPTPDPDYCDHGIHVQEPCYFCRRGRLVPRAAVEHRNPRTDEPPILPVRRSIFEKRGVAGGKATAAKFARTGKRRRS